MYPGSEQLAELRHWQNDRGPKARTDGLNDTETLSAAAVAEGKKHYKAEFWADESGTVVHPGPLVLAQAAGRQAYRSFKGSGAGAVAAYDEAFNRCRCPGDLSLYPRDENGNVVPMTEAEILERIGR